MKSKKTYRVWNIEYDTDNEPVSQNLPTEMIIESDTDLDPEDIISDIISDNTGWCVFGFDFEEI